MTEKTKLRLSIFTRISIHVGILSVSMIALSFLTETQIWLDWFNSKYISSENCICNAQSDLHEHYHWNYRGWVYFLTGLFYFILSVVKIVVSNIEYYEENY